MGFQSGLPLQFGDLFITSLGKVDHRRSYHDNHHIWPVGYACRWHDKISGSVFLCNVMDGGDSGPIFKIKRYPCSSGASKSGKIVLLPCGLLPLEDHSLLDDSDDQDWSHIHLLASYPDPSQQDLVSCLLNPLSPPADTLLQNEMGEFHVQGRSSSAVWRMASERLIDLYREVFIHSRNLLLGCSHKIDGQNDAVNDWALKKLGSLSRFCCEFAQVDIPKPITCESELEASCESLAAWLDQDRFGLDMDFAQEIIERLPGALQCRRYKPLNKRSCYSASKTVANGFMTAVVHSTEEHEEEMILSNFYGVPKIPTEESGRELFSGNCIPPGRPLKSRLPVDLMGDVIQVCKIHF